ncbi:YbaB/EbfC family nucleoid-associated protein [soil metagenome]
MNMKGNLGNLMKEAQKMQAKMQEAQKEIEAMVLTGEAGGGLVKIEMNGRYDVNRVTLDPSLMSEEKEMVEDLIAAAVNNVVQKVQKTTQQKMSGLTSGLNLPFDMGDVLKGGEGGQGG